MSKAICVVDTLHDFLGSRADGVLRDAVISILKKFDKEVIDTFQVPIDRLPGSMETKVIDKFAPYTTAPLMYYQVNSSEDVNQKLISLAAPLSSEMLTSWLSSLVAKPYMRFVNDFNVLSDPNFCNQSSSKVQLTLPRAYDLSINILKEEDPPALKKKTNCIERNYTFDASLQIEFSNTGQLSTLLEIERAWFVEKEGGEYGIRYAIAGYNHRQNGGVSRRMRVRAPSPDDQIGTKMPKLKQIPRARGPDRALNFDQEPTHIRQYNIQDLLEMQLPSTAYDPFYRLMRARPPSPHKRVGTKIRRPRARAPDRELYPTEDTRQLVTRIQTPDPSTHYIGYISLSQFGSDTPKNLTLFLKEYYAFINKKDGKLKALIQCAESAVQTTYGLERPRTIADRDTYLRALMDFKRMGDLGRVLYCKKANEASHDTEYIFASNDRVACAFANIAGVPTILTKKLEKVGGRSRRGVVLYNFKPTPEKQIEFLTAELREVKTAYAAIEKSKVRTKTLTTMISWLEEDIHSIQKTIRQYEMFRTDTDLVIWSGRDSTIKTYKTGHTIPISVLYLRMVASLLQQQYSTLVDFLAIRRKLNVSSPVSFGGSIQVLKEQIAWYKQYVPDYIRLTQPLSEDSALFQSLCTRLDQYISYYMQHLQWVPVDNKRKTQYRFPPNFQPTPWTVDVPEMSFAPQSTLTDFINSILEAQLKKHTLYSLAYVADKSAVVIKVHGHEIKENFVFIMKPHHGGGTETLRIRTPQPTSPPIGRRFQNHLTKIDEDSSMLESGASYSVSEEMDGPGFPEFESYDAFMEPLVEIIRTDPYATVLLAAMYQLFLRPHSEDISQLYE